jgi:hypothetical protein
MDQGRGEAAIVLHRFRVHSFRQRDRLATVVNAAITEHAGQRRAVELAAELVKDSMCKTEKRSNKV